MYGEGVLRPPLEECGRLRGRYCGLRTNFRISSGSTEDSAGAYSSCGPGSECEEVPTREAKLLGHVISEKGLAPSPEMLQAVMEWPSPTNKRELRTFLGKASYYRRVVPDLS